MSVAPVAGADASQKSEPKFKPQGSEQSYLDYNAFLMLFMESLKSQDPTDPLKTAEYMGQLAQFSAVEQSTKTNQNLTSMLQQQSINQANNLIGATIKVPSADGSETATGIIKSIQILTDGSIATLEDGTKVALVPGIEISRPPATTDPKTPPADESTDA
ncbi:flagellar hook assembly protein FlgD [Pseudovibrio sp. Tun.PSC04-5.I4]|uniref:flagellar hook assembly protein FlgD n=1 Tax=Pseudovibrio sp. Tun.PSC04-5.I4 TaxID=1798213 RepID=UPI0008875028|nr:flagellar hook assembly protein FlgD [Pseudovibrio sp. Tun.PSC04-5.I4]SDQ93024.1 flagellar basal-body rod modification protein FlgD [Pseudovibrio sp. Tun.PSC04-5.I4]